jgi:hypothetical protein
MDYQHASNLDIHALLHPSAAFKHPRDVVGDADLTLSEKRSILASWASDACAVEASPALRAVGRDAIVSYDDIIDALQSLDEAQPASVALDRIRRQARKRRFAAWRDRLPALRRGSGNGLQDTNR